MEINIMYPTSIHQTSFNVVEQLSRTYTNFMYSIIERNMKQSEVVQEQLNESVKIMAPWAPGVQTEAASSCQQLGEIEALREQVELLTQKIARLENNSKSSSWNRSGKGHFKL